VVAARDCLNDLFAVVTFILRRGNLRSTVNCFMLNLAATDVLVTLVCLPPTMMVDFFESWLLGRFLCQATPYLQASPLYSKEA